MKRIRKWIGAAAVVATVLIARPALSQTPVAAPAATHVVIRAGRLLDVKSGRVLTNQQIVIDGERIASVGPAGASPAGAQVIELPNATVLPGLIDAHTHITMDNSALGYAELGISTPREALTGARHARETLLAGFTTIRNVGANGYADVALRDAIIAGDVPGPRMLVSGPALGITGGHCDDNLLPYQWHHSAEGVADGVDAVRQKVREVIKYGADVVKFCASGGVMSKGDDPRAAQYTLEEMKAIVSEAHRLGRKVAAHAHSTLAIEWASEAGVDSVEHCHLMEPEAIPILKKNGTYVVPTLYLTQWWTEHGAEMHAPDYLVRKMQMVSQESQRNLQRAFQAGLKIAFGTDAAVYPHGLNAHEFAMYTKLGMTPIQAIQTATVNGADLLGWSDRAGAIEPGKYADIIAVDGDPIADVNTLQHVKFVMKGGEVYKNEYARASSR